MVAGHNAQCRVGDGGDGVATYLCSVDSCLIHSLYNRRAGAKRAEEIQHKGLAPSVCRLSTKNNLFFFGKTLNLLESARYVVGLRNQRSLAEVVAVLLQALFFDKTVHICQNFLFCHATQRVSKQCGRGHVGLLLLNTLLSARVGIILVDGRNIFVRRGLDVAFSRCHSGFLICSDSRLEVTLQSGLVQSEGRGTMLRLIPRMSIHRLPHAGSKGHFPRRRAAMESPDLAHPNKFQRIWQPGVVEPEMLATAIRQDGDPPPLPRSP